MDPRFLGYLLLLFILVIYGVIHINKLSSAYKALNLLVFFTLVSESMTWSGIFPIKDPLILYHILLPTTMILLSIVYLFLFNSIQKIGFVLVILSVLLTVLNSVFIQYKVFPSHGLSLLCILAIILSLLTFKNIILLPSKINILERSDFWFATSTLFFYCITFFTFTFYNFLSKATWLQEVNIYSGLILYTGYFLALYFNINRFKYNTDNE
tara:strand:+ start:442 stop:1074 length:633 start_codon:yes stop_codon:yes gene_type:complete